MGPGEVGAAFGTSLRGAGFDDGVDEVGKLGRLGTLGAVVRWVGAEAGGRGSPVGVAGGLEATARCTGGRAVRSLLGDSAGPCRSESVSGTAPGGGAVTGAPRGMRPRGAGLLTGAVERWTVGAGGVAAWCAGGSAGVVGVLGASVALEGPECADVDGVAEVGVDVGALGISVLGVAPDVTGAPRPGRLSLREALRWTVAGRELVGRGLADG
ncbi:hypothetical protein [Streptomyces sp. NPDC055189]